MLAYVCISGVNVGEDDARALGELIADTPVRLDLIDVTDPTGTFQAPTADELRDLPRCTLSSCRTAGGSPLFGWQRHCCGVWDSRGIGVKSIISETLPVLTHGQVHENAALPASKPPRYSQ